MTKLVWDEPSKRRYETGVDRGVLYLGDSAFPWNGLTSVTDNSAADIKSFTMDGIKYLDHQTFGSFTGSVKAFTYPEEFNDYVGEEEFAPGVYLHDQRATPFDMSYRTKVGDSADPDAGYKIHILYNVMAIAGSVEAKTIGDSVDPQEFDWTLSAVPPKVRGIRPTAHVSLHSTGMDPEDLELIEGALYGTEESVPHLPPLVELLAILETP